MRLYWYEIKKVLFTVPIIGISIAILLLSCGIGIFQDMKFRDNVGDSQAYYKYISAYEGQMDAKIINQYDINYSKMANKQERYFYDSYYYAKVENDKWYGKNIGESEGTYSFNYLLHKKNELSNQGKKNTYQYRSISQNLEMLQYVGAPRFYEVTCLKNCIRFCTSLGVVMLLIMIITVNSDTFSREITYKTNQMVLSTSGGVKRIVSAKIAVALTYTLIITLIYMGINIYIYLWPYGKRVQVSIPLNSIYTYSPYKLTVCQFIVISMVMTIVGALAITIYVCFISALIKNSYLSMGISAVFVFLPMLVPMDSEWGKYILLFPSNIMGGERLLRFYSSYNFLGKSILTVFVAVPVVVITSLIVGMFILMEYRKNYRE